MSLIVIILETSKLIVMAINYFISNVFRDLKFVNLLIIYSWTQFLKHPTLYYLKSKIE